MKQLRLILVIFIGILITGISYAAVSGSLGFGGLANFPEPPEPLDVSLSLLTNTSDANSYANFNVSPDYKSVDVEIYLDAVGSEATVTFRIINYSNYYVDLTRLTFDTSSFTGYESYIDFSITGAPAGTLQLLPYGSPNNLDRTGIITINAKWIDDDIGLDIDTFSFSFSYEIIQA